VAYFSSQGQKVVQMGFSTALAVILACQDFVQVSFTLYTDSAYVYGVLKHIETSYIGHKNDEQLFHLFHVLRALLQQCQDPYFVCHLWSHSGLPGPLAEGNCQADALVSPLILEVDTSSSVKQAIQSHSQFHQNSRALCKHFHITQEQASRIIKSCSKCAPHLPVPSEGVNPPGLCLLILWQMDVTHIPSFGRQHYIHVVIDTYSGFVFASPRSEEATCHLIDHCLTAFVVTGKLLHIKTGNGPGYTFTAFKTFCSSYQILHTIGIPYNPQGQALVEQAHQTLKLQLQRQEGGNSSPATQINKAFLL
jgi:hypothetical protein